MPAIPETRGRPREYFADRAATGTETKRAHRRHALTARIENIAILDFETDPFDKVSQEEIAPFAACLHSDNFAPIVIWNENLDEFIDEVIAAIENLPDKYVVYAHNGGKFDYMFFVHKLRGRVAFKGRGIMTAKIGQHELRDSFHIIPEKLAAYHKEAFDYQKMRRDRRNEHKQEIIDYLVSDCVYLLPIVKRFVEKFGFKLSIGQAAMAEIKKHYKIGRIGELTDERLRQYFYGGRVECLAGRGWFKGEYKIYDVNSMYPDVMAHVLHPISNNYTFLKGGSIGPNTVFVDVTCRNWGALVMRTEDNETTASREYGSFRTTKHEFEAALELGLIEDVSIDAVIDNSEMSTFEKFIYPQYEMKQTASKKLAELTAAGLQEACADWWDWKEEYTFAKLLQNNGYGKFAQNPRRFKERVITEPDARPPQGYEPSDLEYRGEFHAIWARPAPRRAYNNVGTAASITGAARAKLMRAIAGAIDPVYCDTDSLICKELRGVEIDQSKLGAWKLEQEISEIIINGKKLYAYKYLVKDAETGRLIQKNRVKSKGASGVSWEDMVRMYHDEILPFINPAPTMDKTGRQYYMTRNLRATVAIREDNRHGRSAVSGIQRIRA